MDAKAWLAVPGVLALIVAAVLGAEDRYITAAKASEMISQTQVDAERGRLETELALAEHELEYLDTVDAEDGSMADKLERRKRYLESRINMMEQRLLELEDKE